MSKAIQESIGTAWTLVTPLPLLRHSVPDLRQGVCKKALLLAADGPDISEELGRPHAKNLAEIGCSESVHEKLKRFYVQWAKMWTSDQSVTTCVDGESANREGLVIWNWYLFFRDDYRGFDFVQGLPGMHAALARVGRHTVLLRFSIASERPVMTAHEVPEIEPTETAAPANA